jgi:succinate dehydrogenase / fumarate reductase, flavoprotein subunit
VHYSMGGLWAQYERAADGGLRPGAPRNHMTNLPHLYAIGEADYQYHGANRLGANSLLSCIFSGLFVAPGVANLLKSLRGGTAAEQPAAFFAAARQQQQEIQDQLRRRPAGGENPYLIHQELGEVMTKAATVVRRNDQLREAIQKVHELRERAGRCSLSDTGNWTNQNLVFTRALLDMFPLAQAILQGALQRDECRGAHFKPDFAAPSLTATDPAERQQEAEAWCDRFEANNARWLKSTMATWNSAAAQPELTYEEVDTSLVPPRPRLYGLVGAELIEDIWNKRALAKQLAATSPTIPQL